MNTTLEKTSPSPIDYIGEVIMEEGIANGVVRWLVIDYDPEDGKCEIEKVAHCPGFADEVLTREWIPFSEVRKCLEAWRYPKEMYD